MQPRQIRDTSRPVRPSLMYSTLYLSIIQDIRAENGPSGMRLRQTGPSRRDTPSITSLPVDHVVQLPAIPVSTKIIAENIYAAMLALIAAIRDMWRDQYPAIRPEPRHWRALELPDIDI